MECQFKNLPFYSILTYEHTYERLFTKLPNNNVEEKNSLPCAIFMKKNSFFCGVSIELSNIS